MRPKTDLEVRVFLEFIFVIKCLEKVSNRDIFIFLSTRSTFSTLLIGIASRVTPWYQNAWKIEIKLRNASKYNKIGCQLGCHSFPNACQQPAFRNNANVWKKMKMTSKYIQSSLPAWMILGAMMQLPAPAASTINMTWSRTWSALLSLLRLYSGSSSSSPSWRSLQEAPGRSPHSRWFLFFSSADICLRTGT